MMCCDFTKKLFQFYKKNVAFFSPAHRNDRDGHPRLEGAPGVHADPGVVLRDRGVRHLLQLLHVLRVPSDVLQGELYQRLSPI